MKISIEDIPEKYKDAMVLLNDQLITNCISADEENGTVIVHQLNIDGFAKFKNGKYLTKTMHGKVEIILPK
jgi:hypothetical protein